jgi:hypothetical protein
LYWLLKRFESGGFQFYCLRTRMHTREVATRVKSLVELDSCSMRRSGRRYGVPFPVTHSKPNLEFGICETAKV